MPQYTDRAIIAEHMMSARASIRRAIRSGSLVDVWDAAKTIGYDEAQLHAAGHYRTQAQVYRIGVLLFLRVNRWLPLLRPEAAATYVAFAGR